ncbi:uncharacterized protein BDV17DRAFT_297890 [Aspergillus undulatus]|uniref:uncharacterized protein n=1 Tax=Aspergillus undulatus TaxID=1810928 RepID=UPI003CCD0AAD
MPAKPPTLTPEQLELYLQRIKYAEDLATVDANRGIPKLHHVRKSVEEPRVTLMELQRRRLGSIPWGNSALVVRRHDGYCMENTNLFYMVGVSVGRNTPTSPQPLQENLPRPSIAPSDITLVHGPLPESVDEMQKVWIYHARNDPQSLCIPRCTFSEVEFTFEDLSMKNFSTSQSRAVISVLGSESGSERDSGPPPELIGIYVLAGREVKRVLGWRTETVEIRFHGYGIEGLRGLASEINSRYV